MQPLTLEQLESLTELALYGIDEREYMINNTDHGCSDADIKGIKRDIMKAREALEVIGKLIYTNPPKPESTQFSLEVARAE